MFALARFGAVGTGIGLWFTYPYGEPFCPTSSPFPDAAYRLARTPHPPLVDRKPNVVTGLDPRALFISHLHFTLCRSLVLGGSRGQLGGDACIHYRAMI